MSIQTGDTCQMARNPDGMWWETLWTHPGFYQLVVESAEKQESKISLDGCAGRNRWVCMLASKLLLSRILRLDPHLTSSGLLNWIQQTRGMIWYSSGKRIAMPP